MVNSTSAWSPPKSSMPPRSPDDHHIAKTLLPRPVRRERAGVRALSMSRTLFLYIFKDLLRIFLLTSGALAGIMSFGGLLRPVTEHGLDASQAAKMLSYFMPAM